MVFYGGSIVLSVMSFCVSVIDIIASVIGNLAPIVDNIALMVSSCVRIELIEIAMFVHFRLFI